MAGKPTYEIGITWSSELNKYVELNVSVGDKHFRIDLFEKNFESNQKPLKEYLRHVERSDPTYIPLALEDGIDDEFVDPLEEFYDWVTKPFAILFREIPPPDRDRVYTLQDCLFPEQLVYTLQVVGDEAVPVPHDFNSGNRPVGALLPTSKTIDKSTLSRVYHPNDIHVRLHDDAMALPPTPRKVYIGGKNTCFFKSVLAGDVGMTVTELTAYSKIHAAKFGEDVRISRLIGIVADDHTSRIVGLLLSYIDCKNLTLSCAVRAGDSTSLEKWLKQITHSLRELHAHEIIWGDAKPENILIDMHGDVYLIDFGGGYTPGRVDKEFMETREGDLQGLERIATFLAERSG